FLFSILLLLYRTYNKDNSKYALVGFVMVSIASLLALLTNNPNTYFLPDLLTNVLLSLALGISLIVGKPLAAYASHITRAWPIEWYWRDDIKPAYKEVSLLWFIFFLLKSFLQIYLIFISNENSSVINLLIGLPATIIVMSISYIYGLFRLKQLKGPSVNEYKLNKPKPYKGQTKGF
ncbi:MAG: DUF3159 domain-containing protein, partial [Ignavibacteria bacterium]|nr:DUF3159 domain-containing protein [Ignavibacteria bacterium]